jgi:TetR/AcrR family transcriptional regulator, transcriptional repressor for nem operon
MATNDTKTAILDSAQDLIQRLGANAMSYDHISKAVGIRKASIHYHFPTKENLLEALLERYNENFLRIVDDLFSSNDPEDKKLLKYMGLFEGTLREGDHDKACLCGMLGAELSTLGPSVADRVRFFYNENEKRLSSLLENGKKKGVFKFKGNSKKLASVVFSFLEGAMFLARAEGGVKKFQSVKEQMMDLVRR